MTRDELFQHLVTVADRANQSPETLSAAGVLYALVGAMAAGSESVLLEHTARFCEEQRAELLSVISGSQKFDA